MAKIVCPDCHGEGYKSKLGAFTSENLDEWFGSDSEERANFLHEYATPGGAYSELCSTCKGANVIDQSELEAFRQEEEYRAEIAREQAMGA